MPQGFGDVKRKLLDATGELRLYVVAQGKEGCLMAKPDTLRAIKVLRSACQLVIEEPDAPEVVQDVCQAALDETAQFEDD